MNFCQLNWSRQVVFSACSPIISPRCPPKPIPSAGTLGLERGLTRGLRRPGPLLLMDLTWRGFCLLCLVQRYLGTLRKGSDGVKGFCRGFCGRERYRRGGGGLSRTPKVSAEKNGVAAGLLCPVEEVQDHTVIPAISTSRRALPTKIPRRSHGKSLLILIRQPTGSCRVMCVACLVADPTESPLPPYAPIPTADSPTPVALPPLAAPVRTTTCSAYPFPAPAASDGEWALVIPHHPEAAPPEGISPGDGAAGASADSSSSDEDPCPSRINSPLILESNGAPAVANWLSPTVGLPQWNQVALSTIASRTQ